MFVVGAPLAGHLSDKVVVGCSGVVLAALLGCTRSLPCSSVTGTDGRVLGANGLLNCPSSITELLEFLAPRGLEFKVGGGAVLCVFDSTEAAVDILS